MHVFHFTCNANMQKPYTCQYFQKTLHKHMQRGNMYRYVKMQKPNMYVYQHLQKPLLVTYIHIYQQLDCEASSSEQHLQKPFQAKLFQVSSANNTSTSNIFQVFVSIVYIIVATYCCY